MSLSESVTMVEISSPPSASSCVRIFPRQALSLFAKFLDQRAIPVKVTIVDLSKVGMGILVSEPKMHGVPCAVAFDVIVDGMPRRVNIWAKIVYCSLQKNGQYRIGAQIRDCDAKSRGIIEGIANRSVICGH